MNNTCGTCGGFIGTFVYGGDGAKICNCHSPHPTSNESWRENDIVLNSFTIGNATIVVSKIGGKIVLGMDAPNEEKLLEIFDLAQTLQKEKKEWEKENPCRIGGTCGKCKSEELLIKAEREKIVKMIKEMKKENELGEPSGCSCGGDTYSVEIRNYNQALDDIINLLTNQKE